MESVKSYKILRKKDVDFSGNIGNNMYLCSHNHLTEEDMSIDTYKLTSTEEPTDEVLSQLMREAAEEAAQKRAEATAQFFNQLKSNAQKIETVW